MEYRINNPKFKTFYQVLGVSKQAPFRDLKRAYYRRAKECHPDLHSGNRHLEEEFKLLVNAFDVLSDPKKRKYYDQYLLTSVDGTGGDKNFIFNPPDFGSIMDSFADDILEELIVGNTIPKDTTLQFLLRDLEHTENFMAFREAKVLYFKKQYKAAIVIYRALSKRVPSNILYMYFQAECARKLKKWWLAEKCYKSCLKEGRRRMPPQRLQQVRNRLFEMRSRDRGLLGKIFNFWSEDPEPKNADPAKDMIDETSRAMQRMLDTKPKGKKPPSQKRLK